MKRPMLSLVWISAAILVTCFSWSVNGQNAAQIPTETKQDSVRQSMRAKSQHAQSILPALVMGDFKAIEDIASTLKSISLKSSQKIEGEDIENELYHHFRLEFLRVSTQLEQMAKEKNLEGAAYAYEKLTANCLACHSYLNDQNE